MGICTLDAAAPALSPRSGPDQIPTVLLMTAESRIFVATGHGGNDLQRLLARSARTWRDFGCGIVGVLAEPGEDESARCGAGFLRDIASGETFSMALEKPPIDTACHLDARGVQAACTQLLPQIPSSDIVILSKFGKLEADRQGLWAAFRMAIAAGKPVLTTVSSRHAEAWTAFAPTATRFAADPASLAHWWRSVQPLPGDPA